MSTATLTKPTFDTARAEAFGAATFQAISDAFKVMLISVGHQAGLFDTMSALAPSTSHEIAIAAGLDERYVREWLNGLVTSKVVEFDPEQRKYSLPPEHAASLTRAAGMANLGSFAQYPSLFGAIEPQILDCFRNGGGVPYSAVPGFHRVQKEETAVVYDATLVETIIPLVPGLRERLETGIDVADIGCGSGYAISLLAEAFPNSRFTGFDFSEQALEAAREEAARRGVTNATFEYRDVSELGRVEAFDFVTAFDAIHDQRDPGRVLANIQRSVRPDGTFLMVDMAGSSYVENNIDRPMGTMLYAISLFHCMTVSLALGGAGLGTMWGEELAEDMLKTARFTGIDKKSIEADEMNVYFVCTKDG